MGFSPKKTRLRLAWLLVPAYLFVAQPTLRLMAAGAVIALMGVLLRSWASGIIRKNRVLATTGPYAYTRNPLYLGSATIGLGFMVAGGRPLVLAIYLLLFGGIYYWTMKIEERNLLARFGEEYRRYADRVPLFFPRPVRSSVGSDAERSFRFGRYLAHSEYDVVLGTMAGFVVLGAKWFLL